MKYIVRLIITIALAAGGLAFTMSAANASTNTTDCGSEVVDTPTGVTVTSCTFSETNVSAEVKKHVRAVVNGATQVSWMQPTKTSGKITRKSVKRAPLVHVTMKTTSKKLWRKSHGSRVVRVVGDWRNDGRLGHIVAGFRTHSSFPGDIMVWNGKLHKYEHGASLWRDTAANRQKAKDEGRKFYGVVKFRGMRYIIVGSCFNDFHGTYNVWIPGPVTQVKSEDQVLEDVTMVGMSSGWASMSGTKQCPGGDITWSVGTNAATSGEVHVLLKAYVVAKMSGPGWAEAVNDAYAAARGSSTSISLATLKVTCSETPPPPPATATVSLDQLNDLDATNPNCDGTPAECQSFALFQGHVMVPSEVSGTLTVSATYETVKFTGNGTNTMSLGAGSYDPEIKLIAGTELPPTDCTGRTGKCSTVTLTFTPTGGGSPVTASTEIRINPPPTPPQ